MAPTVKIWWDTKIQAYRLSSSYSKELVEALKNFIPVSDRSYDENSRVWTFTEKYYRPVVDVVRLIGGHPSITSRADAERAEASQPRGGASQSTPSSIGLSAIDITILQFFKTLPFESAQKAYRDAAMRLHPDRGGNMDSMSTLNAAWTKLEKEFYKLEKYNQ